ncbi:MAG: DNA-directed RNA polymerase subunit omega [Eubacteriales bacterium]|jgi:DNA-directed RNA polymerase subunit K/omega
MIYPPIEELTNNKYNRYMLVIATAKCARLVTDEYCEQRAVAEKLLENKQTDKSLASMIKREIRDEKAVKTAINRLHKGSYRIVDESLDMEYQAEKLRLEMLEEEEAERVAIERKQREDDARRAQLKAIAEAHANDPVEEEDEDSAIDAAFELKAQRQLKRRAQNSAAAEKTIVENTKDDNFDSDDDFEEDDGLDSIDDNLGIDDETDDDSSYDV